MRTLLLTLAMCIALSAYAQNLKVTSNGVYEGVIRVKFMPEQNQVAEQVTEKIQQANLLKSAGPVVVATGIQQFDALNSQFEAVNMKRVFRPAGIHEEKHKAFGLHLWYEIEYSSQQELNYILNKYQNLPEVEIAEAVKEAALIGDVAEESPLGISGTNDPGFNTQWHYNNTGQTGGTAGADISLLQAWQKETGHANVVVAIIDGGIDPDHPDLMGNFWVNSGEIAGNGVDDDNNGYVDDVNGYNFANNSGTIVGHSHGTHVAGTVAAETNNGETVAGIAGGSGNNDGARLMSCQVFTDTGNGGFTDAFVYAADNGAVISQNSWGYTQQASSMGQAQQDAIDYFIANAGGQGSPVNGGIVIFAAGNDGSDSNGNLHWYPGYYSAVMAVASTDHKDKKSSFSNYGTWVDIAAPGSSIISTRNGGGSQSMSGTSMACPHVSGVAALVASQAARQGVQISAADIWNKLVNNTDPIDNLNSAYAGKLGSGRLNADQALTTVQQQVPVTPTGLVASNVAPTQFTLSWNAAQFATTYNVQVRISGGAWTTTSVTSTSTNVTAVALTTYEFRVNAQNSLGTSAYSAIGNVTTPDKAYCASKGNDFSYEWLAGVEIGDLTNNTAGTGYSDYTSKQANLAAGAVVDVVLTPGFKSSTYTEHYSIWIDFNNDKDFEDAGEQVYTASGTAAVSGQFTLPAGLDVTTRMRVTMKYNAAPTPCEAFSYGEVEDYTVVISQGTINPPAIPAGLQIGTVGTNAFDFAWNASVGATSYDVQVRPAAGAWTTFNTTATTYSYGNASPNSPYEYKVSAKNSAGNSAYTAAQSVTTNPVVSYCSSKGNNVNYEYLDLVQLNEINNATVANGGYGDFTNLTATLAQGSAQTIYLSCGFASTTYNEYYRVWIDYNQNGTFEDAEKVAEGASNSNATLSYNFTVPTTAQPGTTRMRVSMKWNAYATACEAFSYGEVEDYTVKVAATGTAASVKSSVVAEPLKYKAEGADLRIYPVPVEDQLFINFVGDQVQVTVRNSAGNVVLNANTNGERSIDVSQLAAGMYFITIRSEEKVVTTRFVKK